MSEQISEQISALLDGELPEAELSLLLRQIERQPELLQQAQAVQQARLCVQGEQPLSLSQSIAFTSRVQSAIREESIYQDVHQDLNQKQTPALKTEYAQAASEEGAARAAFSAHENADDLSLQRLSKTAFANKQAASNESRWRPIFGAGVAAAVALVAVNAWQTQAPTSNTLEPSSLTVENDEFSTLAVPTQVQTQSGLNTLQVNAAARPANTATQAAQASSSYTVPNFDNLNVDSPIAFNNDFRQVSYADYLLQNNLAPQSTSRQLSRFAEEQRATIYKEQVYIDPQTGDIIYSIRPIIK